MSQAAADALVEEAHALFQDEAYAEAATRYQRATQLFPPHALAWKGLGNALLRAGRSHEAARAFDHAIGLAPSSATALWGGAVAHAEVGNQVVARDYLRRTLALQPTWIDMAREVPGLASFLQTSTRTAEALRRAFGAFSTRTYRHAAAAADADADAPRAVLAQVEVGRITNAPVVGQLTFVSVGLSNRVWSDPQRPRIELLLASTLDDEVCGQILANLVFHLGDTGFFPEPGVMVRDVVGALAAGDLSRRLPHIYVAVPRPWRLDLPLDAGPPAITLAQVIPVSEAEYASWRADAGQFERALVSRRVEVADLRRTGA